MLFYRLAWNPYDLGSHAGGTDFMYVASGISETIMKH